MALIPQINNPISGRSYTSSSNLSSQQSNESGELFDIVELAKTIDVNSSTEQDSGNGQKAMAEAKDFLPMSVKIAKNPTMAVESLKQLINSDLLSIAKSNGYTELYGELDTLMKTLFLKPDDILNEIMLQEKQNTMFSGSDFFDVLRNLVSTDGIKEALIYNTNNLSGNNIPEEKPLVNNPNLYPINSNITSTKNPAADNIKNAVGNLLKAINYTENKDEILNALSSNMKFLSKYFSPNKALSEQLEILSNAWGSKEAPELFENLKNETLYILKNVSESLLNNEHTQVLIPLVIHNLSRYNTNENILKDYFSQLSSLIPNQDITNKLNITFDKLIKNLFPDTSSEFELEDVKVYDTPYNTTNQTKNQPLEVKNYAESQIPKFLKAKLSDEDYMAQIEFNDETVNAPVRSYLLGKSSGLESIKNILISLVIEYDAKNVLSSELNQIDNISSLVDYLNNILKDMPDTPERQQIYDGFVEIINNMAEKNELPPEPFKYKFIPEELKDNNIFNTSQNVNSIKEKSSDESSIKQLVEFVEKNIDHSALKTINNYNASNLLQSLINAPGVFTPLAHYIIPLQIEDTQAFGELWVDHDEESSGSNINGSANNYHLFLTFEVEALGRFEVDMISSGQNVNLSLLHPEEFKDRAEPLIRKVNKIVAQSGYITKSFTSGTLKKPHNLTDVFPSINERRTGFNVKA